MHGKDGVTTLKIKLKLIYIHIFNKLWIQQDPKTKQKRRIILPPRQYLAKWGSP